MAGPIIELLNYCTAVKFESFEAAESKCDLVSVDVLFCLSDPVLKMVVKLLLGDRPLIMLRVLKM